MVVETSEWPRRSCTVRMSVPCWSKLDAKEWRIVWPTSASSSPTASRAESLFQPAFADVVLVPAEVVAEFVQEGGADLVAVILLVLLHPIPQVR